MSGILREVVRDIVSGQPDMAVIGAIDDNGKALVTADQRGADFVIGQLSDIEVREQYDLLGRERPNLGVISIAGDGRGAVRYELRPYAVSLRELGPDDLVSAIREAAQHTQSTAIPPRDDGSR
jgi:hypothetical protein